MIKIISIICVCLLPWSRFDKDDSERYFKVMAEKEYEHRVLNRYINDTRKTMEGNGMCYGHSVELIRRLRKDNEYCVLMGMFRKGCSLPYHYYVHTKRWGAVDIYPEGHDKEPLVGLVLDDKTYLVPPMVPKVPKAKKWDLPIKQREELKA